MKRLEYCTEMSVIAQNNTPKGAILIDIETTGLKKENAILSIIGCAYYEENLLKVIQLVNDDAVSEEAMLVEFYNLLDMQGGPIITYNGEAFDLPFLKLHSEYNELLSVGIDSHRSHDLYRFLRGFARLYNLEASKQKNWEKFLGIHRLDQIGGKKCIEFYKKYLKTKNIDDLNPLLLHNYEDMKGLAALMELSSLEQFRNSKFKIGGMMEDLLGDKSALTILIELDQELPSPISVETDQGRFHMRDQRSGLVTIPFMQGTMYHFYENYKDYYYLPLEDRAIHKSIGHYVDKDHRQKATAKNCYIKEESIFLPLAQKDKGYGFSVNFDQIRLPLYKENYDPPQMYFNFDDLLKNQEITSEMNQYISNYIQYIFLSYIRS